jgi:hypothetical protein
MSSLIVVLNPEEFPRSQVEFAFSQLLDMLGYSYSFTTEVAGSFEDIPSNFLKLYYGPIDQVPLGVALVIPEQGDVSVADQLLTFGNSDPTQHFQRPANLNKSRLWTYDLIRVVFYLLSRQEELDVVERDAMGRFGAKHSLLGSLGLIKRPILNEAALILDRSIRQLACERQVLLLKKALWPYPYHYAVSLTHDVDDLGYRDPRFGLHCLGQFIRTQRFHALRKGVGTLLQWVRNLLVRRDYARWYLDEWLRLEDEMGFRSTFYFVSAGDDKNSRDPNYDVMDARLAAKLRSMSEHGWEIGVHSSFDSYRSSQKICAERHRLQNVLEEHIRGVRQHYLRFAVPETWLYQEEAGYNYDATLGFRDQLGFRAGLTTPFTPYNLVDDRPFSLLELPLSIMDTVLFQQHKLEAEAALRTVLDYAGRVRDVEGHMVLLWHQHTFEANSRPGWWSVYQSILSHLAKDSTAYVATMSEVATWWQARQCLTLVEDTMSGDKRRVHFRADRPISQSLRLNIVGEGWRVVDVSGQVRPSLVEVGYIILPSMSQNQSFFLEFEFG